MWLQSAPRAPGLRGGQNRNYVTRSERRYMRIIKNPRALTFWKSEMLLASLASSALAAINTWPGAGANKLWSNPANWQAPAGPPSLGEAPPIFVVFPGGVPAAALHSTNDIANLKVDTFALNG